jgi:xanthine dehydrogenase YagT iron-sulfur-binding subunit
MELDGPSHTVTRRRFLRTSLGTASVLAWGLARVPAPAAAGTPNETPATSGLSSLAVVAGAVMLGSVGPGHVDVTLRVNGAEHRLAVEPRVTLLDALRERLGLTGTKKGCDHGECGACTVLANGRRINACMTLAVMQDGAEITTIEGLARGDELHPLQQAFIRADAFQCGYCTSGQIISGVALLNEGHATSDAEIREWMSGNLCRCSAYPNIVAAIREVAHGAPS